jgi:hypothetical protein
MRYNNTFEDDLDATRIKLYEATKNMTPSERNEYYRKLVDPIYEKFGIKSIARAPQRTISLNSDKQND